MVVTLHLHTLLQRPSPNGLIRKLNVELPPGTTMEQLLTREGIVIDEENYLFVVNSRNVDPDHVLNDGDDVDVIPAISGGSTPRPRRLGVKAKFWLTIGPRTLFGDGKADLLEAVDRLGSLRSAAQSMDMSYRHAWGLLRELDKAAGFAFLEHSGEGPRTNLRLTDKGRQFIDAYRRFREPLNGVIEARFHRIFPD